MKIILLSCCLLFSITWLQAQNSTINSFYKTHRKGSEAIGLLIPGWVVQAGVNFSAGDRAARQELQPIRPFLRRLSSVRMLTTEKALPQGTVQNFIQQLQARHQYSTLMRVKEAGSQVNILVNIKERGPKKKRRAIVKNVLLVVEEEGEVVVLTINGRWSMQQVKRLLKEQKVQELWAAN